MRTILMLLLIAVPLAACGRDQPSDRLDDEAVGANATPSAAVQSAQQHCASKTTYDRLQRELFRRGAQVRGNHDAVFEQAARSAVLRVERPVVERDDQGGGTIGCSAGVALDLPPGFKVAGGRTTLSTDLDYVVQPAADGTGDVVTLPNPDAIVVPLATLERPAPAQLPPLDRSDPAYGGPGERAPRSIEPPIAAPPPPPVVRDPLAPRRETRAAPSTSPSFNCARARTAGEIAVCRSPSLALLDRRMAAQFRSAYAVSDSEERATLNRTRDRFLGYRDNCPTEACMADGYRDRMREIDEIMRGER